MGVQKLHYLGAALAAFAVYLAPQDLDPRESYDVKAYHLDLRVDPAERSLAGSVTMDAIVLRGPLDEVVLDLTANHSVDGVTHAGKELSFEHAGDQVTCTLAEPLEVGAVFSLAVAYTRSQPAELRSGQRRRRGAVLWAETPSGAPWVGTSCQGPGAHAWWPCKSNFFNPEDKPERLKVDLTVPADLYAVSNGTLAGTTDAGDGWTKYSWEHNYPLETYTVTANIAPYVVVEKELELPGIDHPVSFIYYVLPENEVKAAVQFRDVPEMLRIYSEAFGPWPFPESKFALVETSFWGMEHSTAVAYGSTYPAWCAETGAKDRYAGRNRFFDYILIHESAHEWWGNAVSAEHWGHFWIHEGFGTYAEGVYVEMTQGRERADEYFAGQVKGSLNPRGSIYRGDDPESGAAYSGLIYSKGCSVLNTLRHYVDNDDVWWEALRTFNLRHRYGNATTEDFRAVVEELTGRSWERFFDEWIYGVGAPMVTGTVTVADGRVVVDVSCKGNGATSFQVPLDLAWREAGVERTRRIWLEPGANVVQWEGQPEDLRVAHLARVLGKHDVRVTK